MTVEEQIRGHANSFGAGDAEKAAAYFAGAWRGYLIAVDALKGDDVPVQIPAGANQNDVRGFFAAASIWLLEKAGFRSSRWDALLRSK